jgi:hypothetical protein
LVTKIKVVLETLGVTWGTWSSIYISWHYCGTTCCRLLMHQIHHTFGGIRQLKLQACLKVTLNALWNIKTQTDQPDGSSNS